MSDTAELTVNDATAFIIGHASQDDVDRLFDALNVRRKTLDRERAASVRVGMTVSIGAIRPKYLANLTGTVSSIDGRSATVTLDAASTQLLRTQRSSRFFIPTDTTEYALPGVPLSCCTER